MTSLALLVLAEAPGVFEQFAAPTTMFGLISLGAWWFLTRYLPKRDADDAARYEEERVDYLASLDRITTRCENTVGMVTKSFEEARTSFYNMVREYRQERDGREQKLADLLDEKNQQLIDCYRRPQSQSLPIVTLNRGKEPNNDALPPPPSSS